LSSEGLRNSKVHFIDIAESTSVLDEDFYGDPDVNANFEWLCGYAYTPMSSGHQDGLPASRDTYAFGDSGIGENSNIKDSIWRAAKFESVDVERYAAWLLDGQTEINATYGLDQEVLLPYVLTEEIPSGNSPPDSRIFDDGGAWLLGDTDQSDTFTGALWNNVVSEGHSHNDVNAVHLCAYGEHLLRNAGYNGYGNGWDGFGYDYISDRAVANNTLMFDNQFSDDRDPPVDHESKEGAGIDEALVDGPIEYARGDAGPAVGDFDHYRSMVYVPEQDGVNGYWVLFDEAFPYKNANTVHTALHPQSDTSPTEVVNNQEYTYSIDAYPRTNNSVKLTVMYGSPTDNVQIREGALTDHDESFTGKYLYAEYDVSGWWQDQFVTCLFPHDDSHDKATMDRISGTNYNGAKITQGNVDDYSIAAFGSAQHNGVSFNEGSVFYRQIDGETTMYFTRGVTDFDGGQRGFQTDNPISVVLKNGSGKIHADQAIQDAQFTEPYVDEVVIDGNTISSTQIDSDIIQFDIPSGTHDIELNGKYSKVDTTSSGNATFDQTNLTIDAAGADVWTSDDEYGAMYEPGVEGDFVAEVTVESQEHTDDYAKAGIMAANDITAAGSSAPDVFLVAMPNNDVRLYYDSDGDGYIDAREIGPDTVYPIKLRLTKTDTTFTGEYSTDGGSTWTQFGSVDLPGANATQDVGMAVTSHDTTTKSLADFSGFEVSETTTYAEVDTTSSQDATFDQSNLTIDAAGADVWTSDDEYGAFVDENVDGDVVVETTVVSQDDTSQDAKAGIMAANDAAAPGSSAGDVVLYASPSGDGVSLAWDSDGDGYVDSSTWADMPTYPIDLRLTKNGTTFTGEYSTDGGSSWYTVDSVDVADANSTQDVALFVCSTDSSTICTADFDGFTIS
jgi:hypothetical protein